MSKTAQLNDEIKKRFKQIKIMMNNKELRISDERRCFLLFKDSEVELKKEDTINKSI